MKILALDSSSNIASVALLEDNFLVAEYTTNDKKTHSQTLMPMIENMLKAVNVMAEDIDAYAVCAGPGSFTGLRIGIASAKGLAHAYNKPVVCVSTLEAMAYNLPYCSYVIVPILDARRDQVYCGAYYWDEDELKTYLEPSALSIDELMSVIEKSEKTAVFIGDGVVRFENHIKNSLGKNAMFSFANSNMQRASSVGVAAQNKIAKGEYSSYDKVIPIYLRKSQAEREYDENIKKSEG